MARHIQIAATSNRRRGAAAAAAFSPASLSGLVTFVEVDRGVEESDGTVPEDGENIKYWRDEWSGLTAADSPTNIRSFSSIA